MSPSNRIPSIQVQKFRRDPLPASLWKVLVSDKKIAMPVESPLPEKEVKKIITMSKST